MKVFEVITEYTTSDHKVKTMQQYVTSVQDSFQDVATYFARHCEEYRETLLSIREVCTIVQHIPAMHSVPEKTECE